MRKYESIELYSQGEGDCLYWESIEEFEEFSKELVQKVKEELSKPSNPVLTTISFDAKNHYEYGENYPYEVIELDFERDMTQEEIDEDNNRYSLEKEQKSLEEELILFGLDGSLAYDNSFAKAYKDGLITINREKLDD